MRHFLVSFILIFSLSQTLFAEEMSGHESTTNKKHPSVHSLFCSNKSDALDLSTGICVLLPAHNLESENSMIHGNLFLVGISQEGPRGDDRFAAPNMLMFDYKKNYKSSHALGINLMLTVEKWTFPKEGYPELFQIGEKNDEGVPYIDAQHPHSSPIMGLTFSDTYRWDDSSKDHVKFFFAPRGQSTEGPIAFMHRNTGMNNPDAPLGHHIGQDIGHITSTVLGTSLHLGTHSLEVSAFHGEEPAPDVVNLTMGALNSGAIRLGHQFGKKTLGLISFAYVQDPEPDEPEISFYRRYSASFYCEWDTGTLWKAYNTFIYGRVENYDLIPGLNSFVEEFSFTNMPMTAWGRIEVLERAPQQLLITSTDPTDATWITATTLGYTHHLTRWSDLDLQAGISVTKYFIPSSFTDAYGTDPWAGKLFLQFSGMKMYPSQNMQHQ